MKTPVAWMVTWEHFVHTPWFKNGHWHFIRRFYGKEGTARGVATRQSGKGSYRNVIVVPLYTGDEP